MNNKAVFFCSDLSRSACEPLYGTASIAKIWFLLEHPQPWGHKALIDNQLPDQVKVCLKSALDRIEGGRFQLIRQGYSRTDYINFFIVVARESSSHIQHFKLKEYEELLDLDLPRLAGLAQAPNHMDSSHRNAPLYLVCTDGSHDKCCAKYGLRTYKSLRDRFGDRIWESSHVGGDRFAANLVCFPYGLYFGRVSEIEAERIVNEYQNGRIFLSNYRGRACYSRNAQIGEFFIRLQSGEVGLNGLRFAGHQTLDQNISQVSFRSVADEIIHRVRFLRKDSDIENPMTCQSEGKNCVVQYNLLEYLSFNNPTILSRTHESQPPESLIRAQ